MSTLLGPVARHFTDGAEIGVCDRILMHLHTTWYHYKGINKGGEVSEKFLQF